MDSWAFGLPATHRTIRAAAPGAREPWMITRNATGAGSTAFPYKVSRSDVRNRDQPERPSGTPRRPPLRPGARGALPGLLAFAPDGVDQGRRGHPRRRGGGAAPDRARWRAGRDRVRAPSASRGRGHRPRPPARGRRRHRRQQAGRLLVHPAPAIRPARCRMRCCTTIRSWPAFRAAASCTARQGHLGPDGGRARCGRIPRWSAQLSERDVPAQYAAIVYGAMVAGGRVDEPIGRHPRDRLKQAVREDGREASRTTTSSTEAHHHAGRVPPRDGAHAPDRVHMAHV